MKFPSPPPSGRKSTLTLPKESSSDEKIRVLARVQSTISGILHNAPVFETAPEMANFNILTPKPDILEISFSEDLRLLAPNLLDKIDDALRNLARGIDANYSVSQRAR